MKTYILLLIFVLPIASGLSEINEVLRKEFQTIATICLEKNLLEFANSTNLQKFLSLSINISDCRHPENLPKVYNRFKQTILEQEVCATWRMREWCAENPARSGKMVVKSVTTNRTALADFHCRISKSLEKYDFHEEFLERSINILTFIMIVGMAICWYRTIQRPVPIHPSKILNLPSNTSESDSFENVTFNTTHNRSRVSAANRSNYSARPKKFRIIV